MRKKYLEPEVAEYLQGVVTMSVSDKTEVLGVKSDGTILGISHWDKYKLLSYETINSNHTNSEVGDLNSDGSIDSTDFILMKRFLLKIITVFPKLS